MDRRLCFRMWLCEVWKQQTRTQSLLGGGGEEAQVMGRLRLLSAAA